MAEQVDAPGSDICETATVEIPGVDGVFEFLQFHIHTNSEHTLDGDHYTGELHMVHKLRDSEELVLAVIGLFVQGVNVVDNAKFSDFLVQFDNFADDTAEKCNMTKLEHWWTANNRTTIVSTGDDDAGVYDLIPDDVTWYNYDGGEYCQCMISCCFLLFTFLTIQSFLDINRTNHASVYRDCRVECRGQAHLDFRRAVR